jgi:hypothetical protein
LSAAFKVVFFSSAIVIAPFLRLVGERLSQPISSDGKSRAARGT